MTTKKDDNDWFIHGFVFDTDGNAKPVAPKELDDWKSTDGLLWVHLNLSQPKAIKWLEEKSDLDEDDVELLSNVETSRPRTIVSRGKLILSLRTINLTPRSEPDDMVFLRLLATKNRLITVRTHPALNFKGLTDTLKEEETKMDINLLIDAILDQTLALISDTVGDLEDYLDDIEEKIIDENFDDDMPAELSEILRNTVIMRRFLSPEKDALASLARTKISWGGAELRESALDAGHRLDRVLEDIALLNDRARINQEALHNNSLKENQRNMYMLSVMATIFLPLSFITGLFGMNVGGIPLSESELGLLIVTAVICIIGVLMLWAFRKLKWI